MSCGRTVMPPRRATVSAIRRPATAVMLATVTGIVAPVPSLVVKSTSRREPTSDRLGTRKTSLYVRSWAGSLRNRTYSIVAHARSSLVSRRARARSGAENLPQVIVAEAAIRVEVVAQRHELFHPRIGAAKVRGIAGVHLAPVRPAPDRRHHSLDVVEILLVRRGVEDVNGDVGAVAAVGRGEPYVVGRRDAYLDREADPPVSALEQGAHL